MKIIKANTTDALALTSLTLKSKSHWGYSVDQIENWKEELTINVDYICRNEVYKLIMEDELIGFYTFIIKTKTKIELDFLFVDPNYIGQGFGKLLMNDFMERLKVLKFKEVILISDPNAEAFYKSVGLKVIKRLKSSIEGRFLPVMEREIV